MLKQCAPLEEFFFRCSRRGASRQSLRLADGLEFRLRLRPLGPQLVERFLIKGRLGLVVRLAFGSIGVRRQAFGRDEASEEGGHRKDYRETNSHVRAV